MSLPVHWVADLAGARPGGRVQVTGDEAHHAVAVRRLRAGERVVLTDGAGTTATGEVTTTGKRLLEVALETVEAQPRPAPSFTVVQALPKGDRGELAVEVLTEVGADRIVPWAASRSVAVWRGERALKSHARWASTAREAAKQARRGWFPEVAPLASTADVVGILSAADVSVVLHEEGTSRLGDVEVPATGAVVVVVGPEGGLAPDELEAFSAAVPVRLGSEVLRTSTAGVVALGALMSRTPRWR